MFLEYIIIKIIREIIGVFGRKTKLYSKFVWLYENTVLMRIRRIDKLCDYVKDAINIYQHNKLILPIEACCASKYGGGVFIQKVKIKDMILVNGKSILESPYYKYFIGNNTILTEEECKYLELLKQYLKNNYKNVLIVLDEKHHVLDGNHRVCVLLNMFGPEYDVLCAIHTKKRRF